MTTATPPVVETESGKVRGLIEGGVSVFRGIPYGRTNGPEGRWRAPAPALPWPGTRDAIAFGPSAPQIRRGKPDRPTPLGGEPYSTLQSEQCLTLNVWTSALGNDVARPVMVWLHGGGFASGSASSPVYSGHGLASLADVVFVSLNHRLGALGFLYLEDADPNPGLLDIVAALRWIRDNIGAFGGDPRRVMIFGESGGGQKVSALLAMPRARGLFGAAAIQSGSGVRMIDIATAVELRERAAKLLGLAAARAADLRRTETDALVDAVGRAARSMPARAPGFPGALMPVVDGLVLPHHPFEDHAPDCSAHVPLIVGYNKTEATYFHLLGFGPNDPAMDEKEMRRRLEPVLGALHREIIAAFRNAMPGSSPWQHYIRIMTEFPSGLFARTIAQRRAAAGGAPTFLYRFDWETRAMGEAVQSPHMIEIPFVLNNIALAERSVGSDPETFALAGKVASAWASLARRGDPSDAGLGRWSPYRADRPRELRIDHASAERPPLSGDPDALLRSAAGL